MTFNCALKNVNVTALESNRDLVVQTFCALRALKVASKSL